MSGLEGRLRKNGALRFTGKNTPFHPAMVQNPVRSGRPDGDWEIMPEKTG
jgi:hypothetical protein